MLVKFVQELALPEPSANDRELVLDRQADVEAANLLSYCGGICVIPQISQDVLDKPRQVRWRAPLLGLNFHDASSNDKIEEHISQFERHQKMRSAGLGQVRLQLEVKSRY